MDGALRYDRLSVWTALIAFGALQLAAMWKIGFAFEYPLDDPYIHLAMASEISKDGYGVNSGEIASAASSALFPLLLTPFADTDFQRFLPLIWNVIGLVLTAWIVGKTIIWSGLRGAAAVILAISTPVFLGSVSTSYAGMEHSLHAAASVAIVYGLARFST